MLSITPDQLASAGGHISRTWGDYGYRIEAIESPTHTVSLFHVCASDGSRWPLTSGETQVSRSTPTAMRPPSVRRHCLPS